MAKSSKGPTAQRSEHRGPGPAGQDEHPMLGPGPGKMAGRIRPSGTENPTRSTPPGSAPKGMKTYREE